MSQKPVNWFNNKRRLSSLWLICLIVFAWSAMVAATHQLTGWEKSLFLAIYNLSESLRLPMLAITQLGSVFSAVLIAVLLLWRRSYGLLAGFMWASALGYLVVNLIKMFSDRARPFVLLGLESRDPAATGLAFPSGHTTQAAITALVLYPLFPQKWRWALPVGVLLVGFSRVYLGVHAPLDIVGGLALGFIMGTIVKMQKNLKKY